MIDPSANLSTASADSFLIWDAIAGAYVNLKTSIIGNAAPGLNTLQSIAAAIANDPVFATSVDNTATDLATEIAKKAPSHDPIFSRNVQGISAGHIGLGNCDNAADRATPISELTQNALKGKAPSADPVFTGTVQGVSKTHAGLSNVDNTSKANRPISEATDRLE